MATILLDTSVIFDHLNGRYGRTEFLDQLIDLEQHVPCIGTLLFDAVDGEPQLECLGIGNLVGGDDAWPEGRTNGGSGTPCGGRSPGASQQDPSQRQIPA